MSSTSPGRLRRGFDKHWYAYAMVIPTVVVIGLLVLFPLVQGVYQSFTDLNEAKRRFAELKARIAKTVAFIDSVPQDGIEASAQRDITTGSGEKAKQWKGQVYLLHYALPHFFFHATTAYDILRHNGVDIGKRDFIGPA